MEFSFKAIKHSSNISMRKAVGLHVLHILERVWGTHIALQRHGCKTEHGQAVTILTDDCQSIPAYRAHTHPSDQPSSGWKDSPGTVPTPHLQPHPALMGCWESNCKLEAHSSGHHQQRNRRTSVPQFCVSEVLEQPCLLLSNHFCNGLVNRPTTHKFAVIEQFLLQHLSLCWSPLPWRWSFDSCCKPETLICSNFRWLTRSLFSKQRSHRNSKSFPNLAEDISVGRLSKTKGLTEITGCMSTMCSLRSPAITALLKNPHFGGLLCCFKKQKKTKTPPSCNSSVVQRYRLTVAENIDALWLGARGRLDVFKWLQPNNTRFVNGFSLFYWMQTA